MKLYSLFNSLAPYRVCIVLALKRLGYQTVGISTCIDQQNELAYRRINPVGLMLTLVINDGELLGQPLAMVNWLDGHSPQTPLLPTDFLVRSKVLEVVYAIAYNIHPVNNMRVLRYLSEELRANEEGKKRWYAHQIQQGLSAMEWMLRQSHSGGFYAGDAPTPTDCCLVPQWANALCMGCDLSRYPRCKAVYDTCTQLPVFIAATPESQQDKIPAWQGE